MSESHVLKGTGPIVFGRENKYDVRNDDDD